MLHKSFLGTLFCSESAVPPSIYLGGSVHSLGWRARGRLRTMAMVRVRVRVRPLEDFNP
jgi:hypothetical protein